MFVVKLFAHVNINKLLMFHTIMLPVKVALGGDQLTVERARNAQLSRINSDDPSSALQGLLPFASDWHAEANFMQVYFRHI